MNAKDMIKIMLNLTIIYVVGGLILAFVYAKTSPIMFIKAKEEKQAALRKMLPEADEGENGIVELGTWEPHHKHASYYVGKKEGEEIGYIVEGFGKGYSSYINVLVAVTKDFVVDKISILHHAETPGLGDEILQESFLNQFKGKALDHLVVVKKETDTDIQAITGATISSRATTEGVREGLKMLIDKMTGEVKDDQGKVELGTH